jgi:hypothetical protein
VSGVKTRIASHARIIPGAIADSVPPTIARSTTPDRTIDAPIPIACEADEQALDTINVGPVTP